MQEISIYMLTDPDTFEIRYIGKTKQSLNYRLNQHMYSAKRYKYHTACWLRKLNLEGKKPFIDLIEVSDEKHWVQREIFWIACFRAIGCPLTNLSIGGESGNYGTKITEETRKKLSNARRGRKHLSETRAKIAAAHSGKIRSLEHRSNMSSSQKGKIISNATKLKHSEIRLQKLIKRCKDGKAGTIEWRSSIKKWIAVFSTRGIRKYIGCFEIKDDAITALSLAQKEFLSSINTSNR